MAAYYNEIDKQKCAWLRELIKAKVILDGEVDERSIIHVRPSDLRGFAQYHFFAGIGVWSYALRLAGWPDDRPVWTGSAPCPSFSCAGKGKGLNDPRHLWPTWFGFIRECRPPVIFGEQADDAIGYGWLDLVQTDLESAAYSVGKAVLGACSVGAPHIRQRLYFVAHSIERGWQEFAETRLHARRESGNNTDGRSESHERGDTERRRSEQWDSEEWELSKPHTRCESGDDIESVSTRLEGYSGHERDGNQSGWLDQATARSVAAAGATRGFWRDCEWWYGRDGKYRPTQSGIFPLAHGVAHRVFQLRAYGDAIIPQVAEAFIKAFMMTER